MDTLIDNRNFPQEMHEQPTSPDGKKASWLVSLLVLVALIIIAFLVYSLFFKKEQKTVSPTVSIDTQVKNIQSIQGQTPIINNQERNRKVAAFFN